MAGSDETSLVHVYNLRIFWPVIRRITESVCRHRWQQDGLKYYNGFIVSNNEAAFRYERH